MWPWLREVYWIVAIVFIIFEGYFYDPWHGINKSGPWLVRKADRNNIGVVGFFNVARIKQTVLNGLGALVGWSAGYYLLFYRFAGGFSAYRPNISDLILFLIAFYGMSGQLPDVMVNKLKLGR